MGVSCSQGFHPGLSYYAFSRHGKEQNPEEECGVFEWEWAGLKPAPTVTANEPRKKTLIFPTVLSA